jgi:hypothetical protein
MAPGSAGRSNDRQAPNGFSGPLRRAPVLQALRKSSGIVGGFAGVE